MGGGGSNSLSGIKNMSLNWLNLIKNYVFKKKFNSSFGYSLTVTILG